jgi:RHS repeat-associated protein
VYSYDGLNRLTTTKNAKGETTTAVYDAKGNVIKMYINEQEVFTKIYDEQGRLTSNVDALLKEQTYQYNTLGLLETSVDRNGTLFNYYYDELGNTTNSIAVNEYGCEFRNQIISPYGPSTVWDIFYYPTASGYSGSIYGKIDNAYSIGGKLMEKVASYDYSIGINDILKSYQGYLYDALGRVTLSAAGNFDSINQIIWGGVTHNEYNKTRIDKVQIDGQGTLNESDSVKVKYNFYPDGKLKSVIFPPLAGGLVLKSEYTYDGLGRLITLTNTKGSTVISAYSYAYDNNGNITTTTETINGEENTTIYGYDALNRIETVKSTKGNNDSYSYDFRGNRKANYEKTDLLTPENVSYSYDELNRLNNVNKDGSQTSFDYTADGYRFVKQTGNETTFYVYDKNGRLNAEVEVVTDGTTLFFYPIANYIWGPDRVLAKLDNLTGNRYYYIYNGHGDVVQILDTAGNIVNSYDYDMWGNFITKDETIHNPFTYFGQTYDESTGLYYLRARYYDPLTSRMLSEDPKWHSGNMIYGDDGNNGVPNINAIRQSTNLYVYAMNNPIMFKDPFGLDAIFITDQNAVSGAGHSSTIMQDKDGVWWYCYWGDKEAVYVTIPDEWTYSLDDINSYLRGNIGEAKYSGKYTSFVYVEGDFTKGLSWYKGEIDKAGTMGNNNKNSMYSVLDYNCSQTSTKAMSMGVLSDGYAFSNYLSIFGSPIPNDQLNNIAWAANLAWQDGYNASWYIAPKKSALGGLITWY